MRYFAGFLLLAACSTPVSSITTPVESVAPRLPTSYTVAINPNLGLDDIAVAVESLAAWEHAVPVTFQVHIGECAGEDICIAAGPRKCTDIPILFVHDDPATGAIAGAPTGEFTTQCGSGPNGYTAFDRPGGQGFGGDISLYVTHAEEGAWMAVIIEHELGHAMGLGHLSGYTVMNMEPQPGVVGLTEEDVREWWSVRATDVGEPGDTARLE